MKDVNKKNIKFHKKVRMLRWKSKFQFAKVNACYGGCLQE